MSSVTSHKCCVHRRDQLSFNYVAWKLGLDPSTRSAAAVSATPAPTITASPVTAASPALEHRSQTRRHLESGELQRAPGAMLRGFRYASRTLRGAVPFELQARYHEHVANASTARRPGVRSVEACSEAISAFRHFEEASLLIQELTRKAGDSASAKDLLKIYLPLDLPPDLLSTLAR